MVQQKLQVDCTYFIVPKDFDDDEVPIGTACENSALLIGDEKGKESNQGELYVQRGIGNALGYWNDAQETSESFVQKPSSSKLFGCMLQDWGPSKKN